MHGSESGFSEAQPCPFVAPPDFTCITHVGNTKYTAKYIRTNTSSTCDSDSHSINKSLTVQSSTIHFSPTTTNMLFSNLFFLLVSAFAACAYGKKFGISMQVDGNFVPLAPIFNATKPNIVFKIQSYRNRKHFGINVNTTKGVYGLQIPQVADNYGLALPIYGQLKTKSRQFTIVNGTIDVVPQAALDQLYDKANGVEGIFLKFGVPSQPNLLPPKGCTPTVLKQVF
ncbi:hypothetical protein BDY17DRAFT_124324 [Neohortaea acidophila]|uniref:Uncharacterized protein n=1 Tax=Neohortaea acidophila TaxID=245834 RepID=A0A6A6PW16_9PEZI|nr:uncharacterized protein BDY17DRAFT_124324 [Neohortaea acidophila]KAF2484232.1 hypothetical protein BDY17DRAFT_124324 [Neohortaea acidophila]